MQTLTNQDRVANIRPAADGYGGTIFSVYVGFKGGDCPGEETIPAHHFNGTCVKTFKTEGGALRAANKFLGE